MTIDIKVPTLPESVADATLAKWYKQVGDYVQVDENLVDLETDKVMLEVPAPQSGKVLELRASEGDHVTTDQVIIVIEPGECPKASESDQPKQQAAPADQAATPHTAAQASAAPVNKVMDEITARIGPAARRIAAAQGIDATTLSAATLTVPMNTQRQQHREPMSRLRQRIAERLVQSKNEAAMLTTFNEVNMKPVMDLRSRYKEAFEKKHGIKLGFMSFFTRAVVEALKQFPAINASIDGTDLLYHNYFDIGIAIGSPRGLVVPVLRHAEEMSMATIESSIKDFALRAKDGKLSIDEMSGGTFTITNGGTFGSMLSTPIINPPQSAILGMHNIVERPWVENGAVVIRPVMYLALSYDHRVVDGRESVQFLVAVKSLIEDPARLLLEV